MTVGGFTVSENFTFHFEWWGGGAGLWWLLKVSNVNPN